MAYVSPKAWTINTTPTHTELNQELIANPLSLRSLNDCALRVHRTSVLSVTNNTRMAIPWQAQVYQRGITWSSSTNPTRITVPITGVYIICANVMYFNVVGGRRGVGYRINGGNTGWDIAFSPGNGVDTTCGLAFAELRAGDYIEIYAYQSTGSSLRTIGTTEGETYAHISLFATGNRMQAALWVPPRTWTDGDKVPAAMFETQIHDEITNLRNMKGAGASVWISKDQSISPDDRGVITWDRAVRNIGNVWDGGKNFVAPCDGVYLLNLDVEWADAGDNTPVMGIGFAVNESATGQRLQYQEGSVDGEAQSGADLVRLLKNDTVQLFAFQDGTESLSIHGGAPDRSRATFTLWAAQS